MMSAIKQVPDAKPDPKIGTVRRTSPIAFPYHDLDRSVEVARTIHEKGGGSCTREQLAPWLGYKSVANGSFVTRVTAAKLFGFIEQDGNQLRTTERGRVVAAPILARDADQAKLDAFLSVPLFKRVFDRFNGQPLPGEVGLRNLLETEYEVVKDRVAPTVRLMLDAAEQAGFFKVAGNRSRMVLPPVEGAPAPPTAKFVVPAPVVSGGDGASNGERLGGGGSGGPPPGDIDPAFIALLRRLPESGTPLSKAKRSALVAAFTSAVDWLYPDPEEGQ